MEQETIERVSPYDFALSLTVLYADDPDSLNWVDFFRAGMEMLRHGRETGTLTQKEEAYLIARDAILRFSFLD